MRAIDVDELKEQIRKGLGIKSFEYLLPAERYIVDKIDRMPTIQPERCWIPCSERLPEEDDYRTCYGYEDGAVWWRNDTGLMGLGWYYPSTGNWAYYDESDRCEKGVGNVVEWMPLPKWEGET